MRYMWAAVLGTEVTVCALPPMPDPPWHSVWGVCAQLFQHAYPGGLLLGSFKHSSVCFTKQGQGGGSW